MDDLIKSVPALLIALGGWGLLAAFVIFYLVYPEKLQIISSHIYAALGFLGTYWQKRSVTQDIEGRFAVLARKMNFEVPGLMLERIGIEWVKPTDIEAESFVKQGRVIMRMRYYKDNGRNLANAVHTVIQKHNLTEVKAYVDDSLRRSIDLAITKRCLELSKSQEALKCFISEVLSSELRDDAEIQINYAKIEAIDELGFFTRIMLVEFLKMAAELYPARVGVPEILKETSDFVDYLHQFPTRAPGQNVDLDFKGNYLKVGIGIVAKRWKLEQHGYEPYLRKIEEKLTGHCNVIYLTAMNGLRGDARAVAQAAKESLPGVTIVSEQHYRSRKAGEGRNAICIRLELRNRR